MPMYATARPWSAPSAIAVISARLMLGMNGTPAFVDDVRPERSEQTHGHYRVKLEAVRKPLTVADSRSS
jgi:hypothetical protein